MQETYKLESYILKRRPIKEQDTLVTLYTRERGKLDLVARGSKKILSKMAGHIEPCNYCDVMAIKGKSLDYLGGAVGLSCYPKLKEDIGKLAAAGMALRTFDKLIKKDAADEEVFSLLHEFLESLDKLEVRPKTGDGDKPNRFALFFLLKLLSLSGYRPELYKCLACHERIGKNDNRFYYLSGGIVCPACHSSGKIRPQQQNRALSQDCIKALRFIIANGLTVSLKLKISQSSAVELSSSIRSYVDARIEP